jgi:hypothetical protein
MDEADETEVTFIPAFEDARLRYDCFLAAARVGHDFDDILAKAKTLYAWCMESDGGEEAEITLTVVGECSPKH